MKPLLLISIVTLCFATGIMTGINSANRFAEKQNYILPKAHYSDLGTNTCLWQGQTIQGEVFTLKGTTPSARNF